MVFCALYKSDIDPFRILSGVGTLTLQTISGLIPEDCNGVVYS